MSSLTYAKKEAKLAKLLEIEDYATIHDLAEAVILRSVPCPAICTSPDCDHVAELESDQRAGWCEMCDRATMQSALVLADLI